MTLPFFRRRSAASPAMPPGRAASVRARYIYIEDGLETFRKTLTVASRITLFWAVGLTFEWFNRAVAPERPSLVELVPDTLILGDVSPSLAGATALLAIILYALINYTIDAIRPGRGKRAARVAGLTVIAACIAFGSPCFGFFLLGPAITLLNPRCATVLARPYRALQEATPAISTAVLKRQQRAAKHLMWLFGIVLISALLSALFLLTASI